MLLLNLRNGWNGYNELNTSFFQLNSIVKSEKLFLYFFFFFLWHCMIRDLHAIFDKF